VSHTPDSGTPPTPPTPREQSEYGLTESDVPDHVTAEVRRLLLEYHTVFDKPPGLPPEREVAHVIPLIPGSVPVYTPPYRLTPAETELVHKTIKEYLMAGLIEPSTSPYGSPIIFVAKPHQPGKLRMCIDTRKLNAQTIAMRQPIPRQDMLFDKLAGATVFSSLDLQSGYHQIRIRKEDVEKSAFITPFGSYNFLVMSFGYRNAPSIFTSMMNKIFAPLLYKGVLVYLDDILVYAKTQAEHDVLLQQKLQILKDNQFYARLAKCNFEKDSLKYLGHIISKDGIAVDPTRLKSWPTGPPLRLSNKSDPS
jgi:hypothetical protein